ncbi:MAG: methyltransferase domain-containing protein [Spirochaetota bacterium]|nr:methyltransferase domain-containing protein [Spirochaetota bacterium]
MKERLIDLLICPTCLPQEKSLTPDVFERMDEDIIKGELKCQGCGLRYPIKEGIASLLPHTHKQQVHSSQYEDSLMISSYLWSHYADILDDVEASQAYVKWAALISNNPGPSLDIGCAVGRMTFEMGMKSDYAIGIDRSEGLIRMARMLMLNRELEFTLLKEGKLMENRFIHIPEIWKNKNVEFIIGDAHNLPFASNTFSTIASLNIIDKIALPISHLKEINRIAMNQGTQFLFSDPFSWSPEVTDEINWLGGKTEGPFAGEGLDNLLQILRGKNNYFYPSWQIEDKGHILWKIRKHQNLFEIINSSFIKARR